MKRVAMAGAALLVLSSFTACTDIGEDPLRDRIGGLPSVVEVTSSVDGPYLTAGGRSQSYVAVVVSDLVESDLVQIVTSADEVLRGRDDVTFEVALDDQVLLKIEFSNDFAVKDITDEVHYWLALSDANTGPLGMQLHDSIHGPYRGIWDPDKTDAVDWEALRAVPDTSTAYRTYFLDDIVSDQGMPTADVLALRDRLAAIELSDEESLSLGKTAPGYIEVRFRAPGAGHTDPTALPSWDRIREAVALVAALRSPQSNVVVQGPEIGDSAVSLHLGECAVIADESADDASSELVAALAGSGIEFPLGVAAGFCNDAEGLTADGRSVDP